MPIKRVKSFFQSESASGVILMLCVALSLAIANSSINNWFNRLLNYQLGGRLIELSTLNWINDGLMAVFFFFVGLEIKHEMHSGHLSSFKKSAVPVLAAIGGALMPAAIYAAINYHTVTTKGWGIPMATDIAFALGALSLLGKLVPKPLKVFLSTLAVVDDLLAILVIAVFYSEQLQVLYLLYGLGVWLLLLLLNKLGVKATMLYILPGIVMWYFIHHSGIHATIAGVLTATAIPMESQSGSPLGKLVHRLAGPVNYLIMPVFAIANTNIRFQNGMLEALASPLGIGIITGLVIGKPIGVTLLSWLSVKLKLGVLPHGLNWNHIFAVGLLAGIGFTMSIFMSFLSFGNSLHNTEAKFAILVASVIAGIAGYGTLRFMLKQKA